MKLTMTTVLLASLWGCTELMPEKPSAAPQAAPAQPAPAKMAVEEQQPPRPTHFRKRVANLVDRNKALAENDQLVEVENRITASNYVSQLSQMYFAAGSSIQLGQLKKEIDLRHAMNERYPTFEEFSNLLKRFDIKLGSLYDWQMYAYDDQTGEIGILEDRAMKKQMYEAAGRDYPHAE